jgi:hypothetical protein
MVLGMLLQNTSSVRLTRIAQYRANNIENRNMITLAELQAVATGTATRSGAPAFHSVSVEEARESVKVKDGNRKPSLDGTQKLTVVIGKHTLPLDCIKAGTTRLAVTADQVEGYTEALLAAVAEGMFDESIVVAQKLAKEQAEKAAANPRTRTAKVAVEDVEGLDLADLEEA